MGYAGVVPAWLLECRPTDGGGRLTHGGTRSSLIRLPYAQVIRRSGQV